MIKTLNKIKIGDLVCFKIKYKDFDEECCVGFIHIISDKNFTISPYSERIKIGFIPQFESLVHYDEIKDFKKLKKHFLSQK